MRNHTWALLVTVTLSLLAISCDVAVSGQGQGLEMIESGLLANVFLRYREGKAYTPVSGTGDVQVSGKDYVYGVVLSPAAGSAFLWTRIRVSKTIATPQAIDLLKAVAVDAGGRQYALAGLSTCEQLNEPLLETVINIPTAPIRATMVSTGSPETPCSFEARFDESSRSATMKVAKPPANLSLFFVVPAGDQIFEITGLSVPSLRTAKLAAPKN